MKKRVLSMLLTASLILASLASGETARAAQNKKQEAKVSSVKITNIGKKLRMQKGKKFRLKTAVSVRPDKKKYKKLKFSSSNKKAVLVNQRGLLKARKKGTAKITVTSKANPKKKASVSVSVTTDVLINTIKLNKTKIVAGEFNEDDIQLEVKKILPSNAKNKKIEWTTSNENVADVDEDGLVTTGDAGTAIITATAADKGGASATCKVTVTEISDNDDEVDGDQEVTPAPVQQGGDNEADLSQGGNEPVTPSPDGNTSAKPPVSAAPVIEAKKLNLSVVTDWLMPGDSTQIKISYDPADTTQTDVNWTFSQKAVSVDKNGKLTVGENFAFDEGETEKRVVVTATSKASPSVSKSIIIKVFDPDNVVPPDIEEPNLLLSESLVPEWTLSGSYGTTSFNEDGTVHFTSERGDGEPGRVYNNGCAWYLDSRKSRTDVSEYEYVMLTVKSVEWYEVKLMTWSGTDNSESFWEKKDYWGDTIFARVDNEDGSVGLIYRTDFVFQNVKNAKSIGVTLKSWDGVEDSNEHFLAKEADIQGIQFMDELPGGSMIMNPEAGNGPTEPLENPVIPLEEENATPWLNEELFGTAIYNADGTVKYNTTDYINNGCAWCFGEDACCVDVSAYKYISVRVKSNVPVSLMTWSSNSHPSGRFEGKQVATPIRTQMNADGSETLIYRVSSAFTNPKQARAAGLYLDLYKSTGEGVANIYEIRFSTELPDAEALEYYFTDIHCTLLEDDHDRPSVAVRDEEGIPCTEIKYTGNNQCTFFELPETIHLSDYQSISITANVPGQIALRGLSDSLDLEDETWYDTYCTFEQYPFQIGSYTDRREICNPGWNRGTETLEYLIDENLTGDDAVKHFSIHTNGIPKGGFGYENYLIYSIVLTPRTKDVSKITLKSTNKNTVAPSTPNPKPSVSSGEVIVPAGDVYEIILSEDNETEATKGKEDYRTNVTSHEDGSVSYTNTRKYNSGMVFRASADGKKVDLSSFDYIEVTLDGPAEPSLKVFNDASSWWNKVERYSGTEKGYHTIRFSVSELERCALDTTSVDGFAIGFISDGCEGQTVRIYSIRVVKKR